MDYSTHIKKILTTGSHVLNDYKRIMIMTDNEPDDLWTIWILIDLGVLRDKEVLFVVDQCGCGPNAMVYLLKCFLKDTHLANAKVVTGKSTKDGFPPKFYGYDFEAILGDLSNVPIYTNYMSEMSNFLAKGECYCLVMKPFPELLELQSNNLIQYGQHGSAYYGSFNVRSQFPWVDYTNNPHLSKEDNAKAEQLFYNEFYAEYRMQVTDLLASSGDKGTHYFETFLAMGDENTVNSKNMSAAFYEKLPSELITVCREWNDHVLIDCIESIKRKLTDDEYALLVQNNYDEKVLPQDKMWKCMTNAKIVRSILQYNEKQIVFADLVLFLLSSFVLNIFNQVKLFLKVNVTL